MIGNGSTTRTRISGPLLLGLMAATLGTTACQSTISHGPAITAALERGLEQMTQGEDAKALQTIAGACALADEEKPATGEGIMAYQSAGMLLLKMGDLDQAESYYVKAGFLLEDLGHTDSPLYASNLGSLGLLELAKGDKDKARTLLEGSLARREQLEKIDGLDVESFEKALAACDAGSP